MTHEIWLPIPGLHPYFASNLGRISRQIPGKSTLIMWTRVQKGYEKLLLTVSINKRQDFLVHRLVAMAFHGLPSKYAKEINHIDGNKTNNVPENLEWVSRQDNLKHYYSALNGLQKRPRGINQWQAKFTDDDVRTIRAMKIQGFNHKEISAAINKNVTSNNICNIMSGRTYFHIK